MKAYSLPEIYDIAFDFRDVPGEVDFLLAAGWKYSGRPVRSAVELACGPAYHTREMARREIISHGLDLSPEMVAYANKLIGDEGLAAEVYCGDMRSWHAPRTYDLVYCLLESFAHLLTNDDIISHFRCVANLLEPSGVYIVQTAHPADFWKEGEPHQQTIWEMERHGVSVTTDFGGGNQQFDPLTEIDEIVISYAVTIDQATTRFEFPTRLRRCSLQTFLALVQLSSALEVIDLLGDLDPATKLTNEPESVRLVGVLRKTMRS